MGLLAQHTLNRYPRQCIVRSLRANLLSNSFTLTDPHPGLTYPNQGFPPVNFFSDLTGRFQRLELGVSAQLDYRP